MFAITRLQENMHGLIRVIKFKDKDTASSQWTPLGWAYVERTYSSVGLCLEDVYSPIDSQSFANVELMIRHKWIWILYIYL